MSLVTKHIKEFDEALMDTISVGLFALHGEMIVKTRYAV